MNEVFTNWLKNNSWAIIFALVSFVSTYSLLMYRIDALEAQSNSNTTEIEENYSEIKDDLEVLKIQNAVMQTDITYIKEQVSR